MTAAILPFASKAARPRNQGDVLWAEDVCLVTAFSEYVALLEQLIGHGPLQNGDRMLLRKFCGLLDDFRERLMTAVIIQLHPDEFVPLRFEIPPAEAKEIHRQYMLATNVIERVQQLRNEIHQSGEPLPPDKHLLLTYLAEDCGLK